MFTFVHHCTACERRQLIFDSMGTAVVPTEAGYDLHFRCWCGAEQVHHHVADDAPRASVAA